MRFMLRRLLVIVIILAASARGASAQFQYEVVHPFSSAGAGGRTPSGPLLQAADGSIYGTTPNGGTGDAGVVFQLLPDRSFVARDLQGNTTGKNSYGGLIQLADGTLYGTTQTGGANISGTIFAITPSGIFVTYDLPQVLTVGLGLRPAAGPNAGPVLAANGSLYVPVRGAAFASNSFYSGGIIRLTPQGVVSRLGGVQAPSGRLVAGPDGYLYGTETINSVFPNWSAYRFLPSSGQSERIHSFTIDEGVTPTALVFGPDGNLYGASGGVSNTPSTVFRMTPGGDVTVLHQFQTAIEGAEPRAPLVVGGDGNLYGVTSKGGAFEAGTIFRISLAGAFEVL